jgi:lipoprotein-anchoring transpeptidase ErfK/SrfK
MDSVKQVGPRFGRIGSSGKALAALSVGLVMLGAHYSTELPAVSAYPAGWQLPVADINAGAGPATTTTGWSATHSFRFVPADGFGRISALDSAERQVIYKLNRIDAAHARRRNLVVPDAIGAELDYAPLPATVPSLADVPQFIAVSRRVQAFGAYEYGRLVRWGPTSTGKATTPTDSGLFFTNWKARTTISTDDPTWILDWYVNFIALKGVAFHQYELPGTPASHGCVRLLEVDAKWVYDWAKQWTPGRGSAVKAYGTPVLVFGDYEYGRTAPWHGLPEGDVARATVSEWELSASLAPALETVRERAGSRTESESWQAFLSASHMELGR